MSKDIKWLKQCIESAKIFSTCGKKKYFAVIVDNYGHVIGSGWNGVSSGMTHCDDGGCPRLSDGSPSGSSYFNCFAIHAEANAILFSNYAERRDGCTLYVNGPPCFECAKLISNSGITNIVCLEDEDYKDWNRVNRFLLTTGISVKTYNKMLLENI